MKAKQSCGSEALIHIRMNSHVIKTKYKVLIFQISQGHLSQGTESLKLPLLRPRQSQLFLLFPQNKTDRQTNKKTRFSCHYVNFTMHIKWFCLHFRWRTKRLKARRVLPSIIIAFKTAKTAPTSMLLWAAARRCLSQDDLIPGKGLPMKTTTGL